MSNHAGLSDKVLTSKVRSPVNANGTVTNSSTIDMQGYDGARFVINIGVLGTNGTVDAKVLRDDNSGGNSYTAITNAALTQVTNANTVQIIDVFRPSERYLSLQTVGHTNGAFISATVDRYRGNGKVLPPTQDAEQYVRVAEN